MRVAVGRRARHTAISDILRPAAAAAAL